MNFDFFVDCPYFKVISPPPLTPEEKVIKVFITSDVIDIIKINEVAGYIHIKQTIEIRWNDLRLMFKNLKPSEHANQLKADEVDFIWQPTLYFHNTISNQEIIFEY